VETDADSWALQLNHFAKNYRAIAWNMPGYGGRPLEPPASFGALAEALLKFFDNLKLDRADIVGRGFGGMVALEFAARHGKRVRTLSLLSAGATFGITDPNRIEKLIDDRLAPIREGKLMSVVAGDLLKKMTGPGSDKIGIKVARASIGQVPPETYESGLRTLVSFDRSSSLPGLAMPALVMSGDLDKEAPPTLLQKMAMKIANAQYISMPGVGHFGNLENPRAFNEALGNFLAER
jgi:3-oxoadipate enol-lactonase